LFLLQFALGFGMNLAVPTDAEAQATSCNAQLNLTTIPGAGKNFGVVGDTDTVRLTVGTGTITGGAANTMAVSAVRYELDCVNGSLSGAGCTDETQKIGFVGNITNPSAGCVDSGGNPVGVVTTHSTDPTANAFASPNEVTFTFVDGSNAATNLVLPAATGTSDETTACAFSFQVIILARSTDATPNTIDIGTRLAVGDATCDNTLQPNLSQPGAIPLCQVCDDTNACTTDTCNQANNTCVFTPSGTCDDSNACTSDACNPATGACTFTPTGACSDGNVCTSDACNPATGACEFTPTGTCDDNNSCTVDACDPGTGQCTHTSTGTCTPLPIPTLSEWAQLGLALILTAGAGWHLRRRRTLRKD
jgi:hypothetical protein